MDSACPLHAAAANGRSTSCIVAPIGHGAAAAAIVSSTTGTEAMAAPSVAISPSGPWAHAQEDAVVEIARPVKAIGRTGVRRIVVVAIRTYRLNANADDDLRLRRRRHGQPRKKRCSTENCFECAHM
jgi:hypothetical protein